MQRFALALTRFFAMLLCFIIGFMSFAGVLVGVGAVTYNHLSIDFLNKFGANIQTDELFDPDADVPINSLTIKGLVEEIQLMASLGDKVDIEDLIERYGLILDEEIDTLIPAGLKTLPLAVMFGEGGFYYILDSVDVGYILAFIPEGVLNDPLIYTLEDHTLADVVDMDLGYLFNGVKLGYLLDVTYEQDANGQFHMVQADPNKMTFNEIIAPIDLGDVLASAQEGNLDLLKVIDESLTDVTVELIATSLDAADVPTVIGGKTLGELIEIGDDGSYVFNISNLTAGVRLGEIFGYYYDEEDECWYVDDETEGADRTEPDPFFVPICGVYLDDLIEPEEGKTPADVIMAQYTESDLKLGDVMGYEYDADDAKWYFIGDSDADERTEADPFFAPICNTLLGDLIAANGKTPSDAIMEQYELAGTKLGDIMGYYYDEDDQTWYVDDGSVGEEREKADALFSPLCDIMLYELINHPENKPAGEVVRDKFDESDTRLGDLMGYSKSPNPDYDPEGEDNNEFLWKDSEGKDITGVGAIIACYTLNELMDGELDTDEVIDDLTLAEVYNLEKKENMIVYLKGDTTDISAYVDINLWYDENGERASAVISALAPYNVNELDEKIDSLKIATVVDLVEYNGSFYTWEIVEDSGDEYIVLTLDESVTAEFADLDLNALSGGGLEKEIETIKIGKFMGYKLNSSGEWEDDNGVVTGIMGIVADSTTANLDSTVNSTTVGEISGYYYKAPTEHEAGGWFIDKEFTTPATGILASLAGVTIENLTNEDVLRENIQTIKIADVLGYRYDEDKKVWVETVGGVEQPVKGIMAAIADSTVGDVDSVINETTVGQIAGYYRNPVDGLWYEDAELTIPSTGILSSLSDLTVGELSDEAALSYKVKQVTIADVFGYVEYDGKWYIANDDGTLGERVDGVMGVLADSKISDIEHTIETEQMGHLLGYTLGTKEDVNGNQIPWWINEAGDPVHVLMNKVANTKFNDFETFTEDLKLGDVIPAEDLEDGYLSLLDPDTNLDDLPAALNDAFNTKSLEDLQKAGVIDPSLKLRDEFKGYTINQFLTLFATE